MKSDDSSSVVVKDLYKSFRLPHEQHSGLKQAIVDLTNRNRKKGYEIQHVLDDISFEIKKGEFFGIVGRNGSGKSTLLKLLAGIYTPDSGGIKVNGTLVPFIELGVGFNPELTGRENVFLNGALLGFSRREMESMYDSIVDFAELTEFMDQKLKNYSSGMQVRLAFSIAIRANGDILMLDEVLAVGDSNFQKKCIDYFKQLKREKKTVILVTHDMGSVERFCDKAILLDKGKIVAEGSPTMITQKYSDINFEESVEGMVERSKHQPLSNVKQKIDVSAQVVGSHSGTNALDVLYDEKIILTFDIDNPYETEDLKLGAIISDHEDIPIFATNTEVNEIVIRGNEKHYQVIFEVDNIFSNGEYVVSAGLKSIDGTIIYFTSDNCANFIVGGRKHEHAVASPRYSIKKLDK